MARRTPIMTETPAAESRRAPVDRSALERHAAIGLIAAALVLLAGTAVDLAILWIFQRQPVPTWEFVAISNTIEAYPRLALGVGLLFPAFHFLRWGSLGGYRLLATLLILLGLAAAVLGVLEVTDYLVLKPDASPQTLPFLRSTALKAGVLGGIFFVLLCGLGALGWRRPRTS